MLQMDKIRRFGSDSSGNLFVQPVDEHDMELMASEAEHVRRLSGSADFSILAVPGAKDCCLEMNSLSKAHNMAGWRLGMIAGEAAYIKEILKVKSQMDSGIFRPLQLAAVKALEAGPEWFEALNAEYYRREQVAWRIMDALGASYSRDAAGLFVWGRIDGSPEELSDRILYNAGVFITPGFIFGKNGEHYIRISLCATVPTLERALEKIQAL